MRILEYIELNKEWIFSGVGIAILGGILALGRHVLLRRRPQAVQEPSTFKQHAIEDTTHESPTLSVERIIEVIHSAPPYQQDSVANSFIGIHVIWKGTIWDVENALFDQPGSDDVDVQLHIGESLHQILFTASVNDFPQLKILKRGERVEVSGKIKKCSGPGMYVRLDVDEVRFPK